MQTTWKQLKFNVFSQKGNTGGISVMCVVELSMAVNKIARKSLKTAERAIIFFKYLQKYPDICVKAYLKQGSDFWESFLEEFIEPI